jgi:hypothetical protein
MDLVQNHQTPHDGGDGIVDRRDINWKKIASDTINLQRATGEVF